MATVCYFFPNMGISCETSSIVGPQFSSSSKTGSSGHLGPTWGYLGAILGLSWDHLGAKLGLSWGQVGPILGLLGVTRAKRAPRSPKIAPRSPKMIPSLVIVAADKIAQDGPEDQENPKVILKARIDRSSGRQVNCQPIHGATDAGSVAGSGA